MNRRLPLALLALAAAPALVLAGCSTSAAEGDAPAADGIVVVASTDVYADIAASIGGDLVTTQAIISGSANDPHSYEATARDQLAVADADLIILNGGGYDPFMEQLVEASGTTATVITAVDASGLLDGDHDHAEEEAAHDETAHPDDEHAEAEHADDEHADHDHIEGFNEHVWYSLHGMAHLAGAIEEALAALDADGAADFAANAEAFTAGIEELELRAAEIEASSDHVHALVSEPVALYLLEAVGIHNVTPEAFTSAVEEGSEISVALLDEVLSLATSGEIGLLAYNEQTVGPETERLLEAAEGAGVPVVSFTETLPEGQDYLSWMSANLEAIAAAVA